MKEDKNYEVLNERCELLEELGFEVESGDWQVNVFGYIVDFSAIDKTKFLEHAIKEVYRKGHRDGQDQIRSEFKSLMGLK